MDRILPGVREEVQVRQPGETCCQNARWLPEIFEEGLGTARPLLLGLEGQGHEPRPSEAAVPGWLSQLR